MSKSTILDAAVSLASRVGYTNITRKAVAEKAGVANGTVSYHFVSMEKLENAVMKRAIETGLIAIIAQGLVAKHRAARLAPQELKDAAAKLLAA